MRKRRLIPLSMGCVVVALFIAVSLTESAQPPPVVPPVYNPYPPGILPDDLTREMDRVEKEIRGIFKQALDEFRALPPPNFQGNPPTLQGTGYDAVRILGKLLNFDENMSVEKVSRQDIDVVEPPLDVTAKAR